MMRLLVAVLLLGFITAACNNSASDSNKELELKEKELALKEKELELKEKSNEAETPEPAAEPSEEEAEPAQPNELSNVNKEKLIGNWFKPDEASVNIKFYRNGRFEFNDYNSAKEEEEKLEGNYELKDGTLTLNYDDRPGQKFKFYKDGPEFYIRKGSYYFVKGDN